MPALVGTAGVPHVNRSVHGLAGVPDHRHARTETAGDDPFDNYVFGLVVRALAGSATSRPSIHLPADGSSVVSIQGLV
jgi:hypothetical protein